MTIAKRFAIFAFMFTPFLFIFCLGNWVIAENMGMNKLLLDVLSKQGRTWFLCVMNILVLGIMPSIAAWILSLLR